MTAPRTYLRTLGAAAVYRVDDDGATSTILDSSKLLALLTYLNAASGRSATRGHLVELLWADLEEEAGRHALRHHLWLLKQRLRGGVVIERAGEMLTLRDQVPNDRDDLLAAASEGDMVRAVSLYRGEFFPDFAASGAQGFEHWAERERTALRSVFVRSGQIVVKQWLDMGRMRDASALARRLRDTDPFDQAGWRLVLETLVSGRDIVGAAMEVDALQRLAADEELTLEPATNAAIARLRHPANPPTGLDDSNPALVSRELVGREAEFAALVRRWDDALRGRLQRVHLTGPAGIGKSRLLQEYGARLTATRRSVVHVRAEWTSRFIEWSFVSDLIGELCTLPGALGVTSHTATLLVGLAPAASAVFRGVGATGTPDTEAVVRRGALRDLLSAIAEEQPVALLLDDMHWCDSTSRNVLLSALDGIERRRTLVVISERDAMAREVPGTFATLPLPPLSAQAVTTLVASLADLPEAGWTMELCDRLTRQIGGSPLHLLETLQLAVDRDVLAVVDGRWICADPAALWSLLDSGDGLRARIAGLGDAPRACLRVLACGGGPMPLEIIAECADLSREACQEALGVLERRGMARRTVTGVVIAHDEIAELVRHSLTDEERKAAFGRAGVNLARQATDRSSMARAATLLTRSGRHHDLAELLYRFVRQARRSGDRRPVERIAAEIVDAGEGTTGIGAHTLLAHLPWTARLGLRLHLRAQVLWEVTTALVLAATAAMVLARVVTRPASAATFTVTTTDSTGVSVLTTFALPQRWTSASPLIHVPRVGRPIRIGAGDVIGILAPPDDSLPYLLERVARDSGEVDIFEFRPGAPLRRLTASVGDDMEPNWSPDGRAIAFTTARWDTLGRRDVAIVDRASGAVRRITSTPAREENARWSPDGSRLAYARRLDTSREQQVCVDAVAGGHQSCWPVEAAAFVLVGWVSDDALLLRAEEQKGLRLDVTTGNVTALPLPPGDYRIVPGVGLLEHRRERDHEASSWRLHSLALAGYSVQLDFDGIRARDILNVHGHGASRGRYVDAVVVPDSVTIVAGVPHRVPLAARDVLGRAVVPRMPIWESLDTSVVAVTSDGDLVGVRVNAHALVRISLGGWRAATIRVRVREALPTRVLREEWANAPHDIWQLFGEPLPAIVRHPDGTRAFGNNGDGVFFSGAYTRDTFPLRDGWPCVPGFPHQSR